MGTIRIRCRSGRKSVCISDSTGDKGGVLMLSRREARGGVFETLGRRTWGNLPVEEQGLRWYVRSSLMNDAGLLMV